MYNCRLRLPETMLTSDDRLESPSSAPDGVPAGVTRAQVAALLLILTFGFAVRLTALIGALRTPGYTWEDPDGYRAQALRFARPDGWAWTFDAVTYVINGQRHALPPGYSLFLSVFALWPGFPLSAQVAQICLAVASIALVFALGRRVHSTRAGLVAAAVFAVWVPNIFGVWSTSQETLYLPLILTAGGVHVRTLQVGPGETGTVRTRWPARGLAFIELDQIDGSGEPAIIEVRVPGR